MKQLKQKYEEVCNEYVKRFCKKQGIEFDGWVANIVGEVAYCNDFYFNFQDIVLDVNSKQPKGLIIDWYYDSIDNHPKAINYYSYIKGLRFSDLKD